MSVDQATVRRIAHLSRISIDDAQAETLQAELNGILGWIEQLNEVDVEGVEPMTSVQPMAIPQRKDVVTDGGYAQKIVANAPASEDSYFMVPKVVE